MVLQVLLDILCHMVAELIALIPPVPPEVGQAMSEMEAGATQVGLAMSNFGTVVPFDQWEGLLAVWAAGMAFWSGTLVLRVFLWIANR